MSADDHDNGACSKCGGGAVSFVGLSHAVLRYGRCDECGHTAVAGVISDGEVIGELANALQAAVLITAELEASASPDSGLIGRLQRELTRAMLAIRGLQKH